MTKKNRKQKKFASHKPPKKKLRQQFRIKSSFSAFKPSDNSVLGKDKGYREKETPAPQ
jgi:hypothetical protein